MMTGASQEKIECILYVYGSSNASLLAKRNLKMFRDNFLPGRLDIKVVDVQKQPELIEKLELLAFPTLIIRTENAEQRLIGTFENFEKLKQYFLKDMTK
jgi:hypothetical protein